MKVYVAYSGCKVNQFEKNLIEEKFLEQGYSVTANLKEADIIVFNSCCVTKNAENGCRQAIRRFASQNHRSKIVVTGCYAEKNPDDLLSLPNVVKVIGNKNKIHIPKLLLNDDQSHLNSINFEFKRIFKERSRAFLKIQDGCDSFCSYCIVPHVRGNPVSMDESVVLRNLKNLSDEREVVLTGIHLGKWGIDMGKDIAYLFRKIKEASLPFRIRLSSLEPNEINEEILKIFADMENFCPHFHIPLQSGSDRILKLMKRKYHKYQFAQTVDLIRDYFPFAGIGIDIIVGFPTETDSDFQESLNFINQLPIDYLHIFRFSPREGTDAYKIEPKVPKNIVKMRAEQMAMVDAEKRRLFARRFAGREVKCLFDRVERGLNRFVTREYLKVYSEKINIKEEFTAKVIEGSPLTIEII